MDVNNPLVCTTLAANEQVLRMWLARMFPLPKTKAQFLI